MRFGLRETKIQNLSLPSLGDNDICRLNVPVYDPFGVRRVERIGCRETGCGRSRKVRRLGRRSAELLSGLWRQLGLHPIAVSHVDHAGRLIDLQEVQRVRVVVDVGDGPARQLDDDVAAL